MSAHTPGEHRDCRTPGCDGNATDAPTRGRYANLCELCRRGTGVLKPPPAAAPAGAPTPGARIEPKVKELVPLAKRVDRSLRKLDSLKAERGSVTKAMAEDCRRMGELLREVQDTIRAAIEGG